MFKSEILLLLQLAGVGQLVLVVASLAIPKVLGWREQTARLPNLTRQVFWNYAGYIWATNLCFAMLSLLAPHWLVDGTGLARAVAGFITSYWLVRVLVQLFYFDRSDAPGGRLVSIAEIALTTLFVALTLIYGAAFFHG